MNGLKWCSWAATSSPPSDGVAWGAGAPRPPALGLPAPVGGGAPEPLSSEEKRWEKYGLPSKASRLAAGLPPSR